MQKKLLLFFTAISWLLTSCVPSPEHRNPFDPETPNELPRKLESRPDSVISEVTPRSITLEWPLAADIDGNDFYAYNVYRSNYGSSDYVLIQQVTSFTRTTHMDVNLTPNTVYEYKIEVEDKGGKVSQPLLARIKTTPEFFFLSELPTYIKSVTAATASQVLRIDGTDTFATLFFLCRGEKTEGSVVKLKVPVSNTSEGKRAILEDGFIPDDYIVDKSVQSSNSYNVSKIENSLFRIAIKKYNHARYDTMKAPLKYHLDSQEVMYRKLSYNGLALFGGHCFHRCHIICPASGKATGTTSPKSNWRSRYYGFQKRSEYLCFRYYVAA
jgi:hypothetical protein